MVRVGLGLWLGLWWRLGLGNRIRGTVRVRD